MENVESLDIVLSVVVVLGVLAGVCYNLQQNVDWLRRIWIYLASVISAICVCVIILLVVQIFKFGEDVPQDAEAKSPTENKEALAPQSRERSLAYYAINDHCRGARDVRWTVRADEGWEIDVNSIKVEATSISKKSSYSGVQNMSKDGFDIVGRIVNHGSCVSVFGKIVTKDARGSLRVYGTYLETRQVSEN